jgi:predicted nuclease of restriction endonuclease-like (RecB) superfamily
MKDYYSEIKNELISNEINHRVKDYSKNKNDLITYFNVGKILSEAGKHYGEGIIKNYSIKLTIELGKGYSTRTLKYMRRFYELQKGQPLAAQFITWSHYIEILKIKDINEINYYIQITINNNLSRNELRKRIKSKEYDRLDETTKLKIIHNQELEIKDNIKNPIVIYNKNNYENISEKVLQKIILEDIPFFLKELGEGYSFISNEYKIRIGNTYNYIDLLLFNIKYNCYVVIELKVVELKKEHIGQIETYMNYIDKNIKNNSHNNTI